MFRQTSLVMLIVLAWPAARAFAQPVTVSTVADAVRVRAPGFSFIKGESLARLKDGQSVRVDLHLRVLPRPDAEPTVERRQTFVLSYDLWEERFAVTQAGGSPRSISHLTSAAAETWCLEQLAVPVNALGPLGRDMPFWIRLEYRVLDGADAPAANDEPVFTLRGLIDALSRRRTASESAHSIEAGPFRVRE
jgi:hypothetical protein